MFQHCLICTDFSDGLHRLVNFIPQLASSGLKRIIFFHSVSVWREGKAAGIDEAAIASAKAKLAKALENVPEGVEVKIEVPSGQPVETIVRIVARDNIDIIFMGTPMRSALEEKFFGSTSRELAKSTETPLLILRPQLISTYTQEELALRCQHLWRYLLIPYNDSEAARYLIQRLKEYAQKRSDDSLQQCMLLWVVDDGGRKKEITDYRLQEAQQKLDSLKTELEALNLTVNVEVRQGNPTVEILNAALNFDISAIAISTDYRNNVLEWAVASCAEEVLHRSWFPVLFFSPKK